MPPTINAQTIDLRYLIDNFGLQRIREPQFFSEWQESLPELTLMEKELLDRIQASYFNLIEYPPVLENAINLTIISPILFTAGFYLPPFHVQTEKSIEIQVDHEGQIITGRIDILILKNNIWITIIESKRPTLAIDDRLSQLLTYMLAIPNPEQPMFGLITNGLNFRFLKLVRDGSPRYATSDEFILDNQGNELYDVLKILKKLGAMA
ncbi:MAG: restriction endonuclease subunit R [Coleofasciculaceae cyanobacterium SM2_1_6]|nr:restriction endonuclease subunit R [Coleofasciculaceae cyanobacterium SM2_1_6]